ncbi:antistasin-like isoform X2 [Haliotis asinina]|uniref:antistasin-like isoform X2 n=1 Tax=Haliotis asinina TaxID=109174 RepID=UPI0035325E4C
MDRLVICLLFGLTLIVCSAVTHVQGKSLFPPLECRRTCARPCKCGQETDSRGCATCKCKPCGYNCPYYRPCQQWLRCTAGFVEINGCPTCMCKPTPKTTPTPQLCLMCCGPPPCCNYCGLEKLFAK